MSIPPNVLLVQGTSPQDITHKRVHITIDLPTDFDNGEPITRDVSPGKLTLMIRKIPDNCVLYASKAKVSVARV